MLENIPEGEAEGMTLEPIGAIGKASVTKTRFPGKGIAGDRAMTIILDASVGEAREG